MYRKLSEKNKICTGCSACYNICKNDAIQMVPLGEEYSLTAVIDETKCIKCNECVRACPELDSSTRNRNSKHPAIYAAMALDEIRMHSSSGGMFSLLAQMTFDNGGVVCAVSWDPDFSVSFKLFESEKELVSARYSKYIQANVGNVLNKIKNLLKEKRYVLFVGCPCQVAGLKSFLKEDYDRLLLVDLVCSYSPSQSLFKKYFKEKYEENTVDEIRFRNKKIGWNCEIHTVFYNDGTEMDCRPWNDAYQRAFHSKLMMRHVCEKCNYAGVPRVGDITIGDFWGIKDVESDLDDQKGTSLVLINNIKGRNAFEKIKSSLKKYRSVDKGLYEYNRSPETKPHKQRDRFYRLVNKTTFNEAVNWALNPKYDIAVIGNYTEKNYGSELTYYALYRFLKNTGYEVMMIERPLDACWKGNDAPVLFRNNPYEECDLITETPEKLGYFKYNTACSTFIIGSDQMWNPNLFVQFGKVATLDFVSPGNKKVSYATSLGVDKWENSDVTAEMASDIRGFDAVSVREESAVDICKSEFGVNAVQVVDPVFLLSANDYLKFVNDSSLPKRDKYIAAYILDNNKLVQTVVDDVIKKFDMPCNLVVDAFKNPITQMSEFGDVSFHYMEDWIKNIAESDFVITDSFHGTCLSIIFGMS